MSQPDLVPPERAAASATPPPADQACPKCRLISPAGTARCDCGWNFAAGELSPGAAREQERRAAIRARASWLCPVAAWASQLVIDAVFHDVRAPSWFWALVVAAQGALLLMGFYCAAKVLALGRWAVPPRIWRTALVGVILSAGTVLLIVALAAAGAA